MAFIVETTGTYLQPIVFDDLGGRTIIHPTPVGGIDLSLEYPEDELASSPSINAALNNGWIRVIGSNGIIITGGSDLDSVAVSPHNMQAHQDVLLGSIIQDKSIIGYDSISGLWKDQTAQELGLSEVGHTHGDPSIKYYYVSSTSQLNTTASGYVFMSGMELMIDTVGTYLCMFSGKFETNDGDEYVSLVLNINGNNQLTTEREFNLGKDSKPYSAFTHGVVSIQANDVLRVYWKRTNSGTMKVFNRELSAFRIGA